MIDKCANWGSSKTSSKQMLSIRPITHVCNSNFAYVYGLGN